MGDKPTGAILALDLGTKTGWACCFVHGIIQSGTHTFDKRGGPGHRFLRFRAWLTNTKNGCGGGIEAVWYERIDFLGPRPSVENARSKFGFEATLGAWCEHHEIPYTGIPPSDIKKFATGNGRADKRAVMRAMLDRGYKALGEDEADAVALLLLALEHRECATGVAHGWRAK